MGSDLAFSLASRWLYSNFLEYKRTGYMMEKYFAPKVGVAGYGGEYQLQTGFGWTNGVALILLDKYAPKLNISQMYNSTVNTDTYPYDGANSLLPDPKDLF